MIVAPYGREDLGGGLSNAARPYGRLLGYDCRALRALAASRPQLQFHCCHQQILHNFKSSTILRQAIKYLLQPHVIADDGAKFALWPKGMCVAATG